MVIKKKSESLAQKAYELIRRKIISGKLRQGEMVSISALAESLSISRTPVTLACQKLEYDHLITVAPKQGVIINIIGVEEAREIYELRAAIETYAAKHAFQYITDGDIAVLKKYDQELQAAIDANDPYTFMTEDTAFHKLLLSKYKNSRLFDVIENLYDRAFLLGIKSCSQPERMRGSLDEHEIIITALERRDLQEFIAAVERNIMNGYASVTGNYSIR